MRRLDPLPVVAAARVARAPAGARPRPPLDTTAALSAFPLCALHSAPPPAAPPARPAHRSSDEPGSGKGCRTDRLPGLRRVEAVATGAIAIRTNHWGKWGKDSPIGPPWELDEAFGYPYGVDGEISLRAWRLGLRVGACAGRRSRHRLHRPGGFHPYGVAGITPMFNAVRMACLYMSSDVVETVLDHYRNVGGFSWLVRQLLTDSDTTDRRRLLDQMGPAEMANLTPVLREFGGLDVAVGGARVLMRRPPGESASMDGEAGASERRDERGREHTS